MCVPPVEHCARRRPHPLCAPHRTLRPVAAVLAAARSRLRGVRRVGEAVADEIVRAAGNDDWKHELDAPSNTASAHLPRRPRLAGAAAPHADPPICLYMRGTIEPEDAVAVAIVGSRKCSHYGREESRRFAYGSERGATIVSGLARASTPPPTTRARRRRPAPSPSSARPSRQIYPPETRRPRRADHRRPRRRHQRVADGHGAGSQPLHPAQPIIAGCRSA